MSRVFRGKNFPEIVFQNEQNNQLLWWVGCCGYNSLKPSFPTIGVSSTPPCPAKLFTRVFPFGSAGQDSHEQTERRNLFPRTPPDLAAVICASLTNKEVKKIFGEGNGTPLQYSCLESPMDGGAW